MALVPPDHRHGPTGALGRDRDPPICATVAMDKKGVDIKGGVRERKQRPQGRWERKGES